MTSHDSAPARGPAGKQNPALLIGIGAVAGVLLVILAIVVFGGGRPETPPSAPTPTQKKDEPPPQDLSDPKITEAQRKIRGENERKAAETYAEGKRLTDAGQYEEAWMAYWELDRFAGTEFFKARAAEIATLKDDANTRRKQR